MSYFIKIGIIIPCIMLSYSNSYASPDPMASGNALYAMCNSGDEKIIQTIGCISYIRGMFDGFSAYREFKDACIPENVTSGQAKDIFLKFLKDHPETRHEHPTVLFALSMSIAFPCSANNSPSGPVTNRP